MTEPIQINLGEGRILVSIFHDKDGSGLLLEDTGEPHEVGSMSDKPAEENHAPKHGEIYIKCWNLESAKSLLLSVIDLVVAMEKNDLRRDN